MKIKEVESQKELKQILQLQSKNHYNNIPEESRKDTGFVTVIHSERIILKMNSLVSQIVACDQNEVVGYAHKRSWKIHTATDLFDGSTLSIPPNGYALEKYGIK